MFMLFFIVLLNVPNCDAFCRWWTLWLSAAAPKSSTISPFIWAVTGSDSNHNLQNASQLGSFSIVDRCYFLTL